METLEYWESELWKIIRDNDKILKCTIVFDNSFGEPSYMTKVENNRNSLAWLKGDRELWKCFKALVEGLNKDKVKGIIN